jgi:rhamnose transport system permease protein
VLAGEGGDLVPSVSVANRKPVLDISSIRILSILLLLVVLLAAVIIRNPHFLDSGNLRDVFMDTSILGIAAIAQLAVMLTANIDVSSSSTIAVSGFSAALLMKSMPGLHPVMSLILALAIGCLLGGMNGVIVGFGEVPSIIVTLGTLSIYRGITYIISGGGWVVSRDLPDSFRGLASGTVFGIPHLILAFLGVAMLSYVILNFLRPGRVLYAVGSSLENARILGINTRRVIFSVFTVSGMLYGLCGALWVSRYNFAQSSTASGYELTVIAACVIGGTGVNGGRGSVQGVVLGAFLLSFIINAINIVKISPFWKMAIQGIIILAAVLFDSYLVSRRKS